VLDRRQQTALLVLLAGLSVAAGHIVSQSLFHVQQCDSKDMPDVHRKSMALFAVFDHFMPLAHHP
jgi:hypothetical protein